MSDSTTTTTTTKKSKKSKKSTAANNENRNNTVMLEDRANDIDDNKKLMEESTVNLPEIMATTMKNIPNMPSSPSFYANLFESAKKSPMAAVSSVMALFMVVIAALVVTALFTPCKADISATSST